MNIGGNKEAVIQVKAITNNEIGEGVPAWVNALPVMGWLDLLTGDSESEKYNAKMQESTHIFLCDYFSLIYYADEKEEIKITPENSRIIVEGEIYEVTLYDDPMGLHEQLEIFLKFTGG